MEFSSLFVLKQNGPWNMFANHPVRKQPIIQIKKMEFSSLFVLKQNGPWNMFANHPVRKQAFLD